MEQRSGTKTRIKKGQKKQGVRAQALRTGSGKTNLPYLTLRNEFLELSQEDLLAIAENEQHASPHRFDSDLPEEEDDESWEPEEEEYLSDDWDARLDTGFAEDQFGVPEPCFSLSSVSSSQVALPAVVVDREQDVTNVKLEVRLANTFTLRTLISTWRQAGQHDRADVLGYRLTRLLDVARYVVAQQEDFFLRREPRRPLEAIQVAQALWPEENLTNKKSTVSYLTNGKALRTPWGEIIALTDLLPSTADCLLEPICRILREHDHVREVNGRRVVQSVIRVDSQTEDSVVKQLRRRWQQWLGHTDGLSPENVKHIMKRNNIPRVANERKAAYEQGKAWWVATP